MFRFKPVNVNSYEEVLYHDQQAALIGLFHSSSAIYMHTQSKSYQQCKVKTLLRTRIQFVESIFMVFVYKKVSTYSGTQDIANLRSYNPNKVFYVIVFVEVILSQYLVQCAFYLKIPFPPVQSMHFTDSIFFTMKYCKLDQEVHSRDQFDI